MELMDTSREFREAILEKGASDRDLFSLLRTSAAPLSLSSIGRN